LRDVFDVTRVNLPSSRQACVRPVEIGFRTVGEV
jgi:hypothetical protein